MRWNCTLFNDRPQPELDGEHRIGWNQTWNAFLSVGEMRTDADFQIAARLHPYEGMLNAGDGLAPAKYDAVIDERSSVYDPDHRRREMLGLPLVQRNLLTFFR